MSYSIENIATIVNGKLEPGDQRSLVEQLLIDSRKLSFPPTSLFFALEGPRRNGHLFIEDLYRKGVRNFVVHQETDPKSIPGSNIITVSDTLMALQALAAHHRKQFSIPVIGITGSNGKTIVKEWLNQLLHHKYNIVRSPKSYNSQIGVPLSVWQINEKHNLGVFEAGISRPGEMEKLETIIQPEIGILTNIGEAHSEGFESPLEKAIEKIKLFRNAKKIIYSLDNSYTAQLNIEGEHRSFFRKDVELYAWSRLFPAWLKISDVEKKDNETLIYAANQGKEFKLAIPFTDDASIENGITCWCTLLVLGYDQSWIQEQVKELRPLNMRLELKKGINHCSLINDSYSADIGSLGIALNFLEQQAGATKKTVILSDFQQSGIEKKELYKTIFQGLIQHKVSRAIAIGSQISEEFLSLIRDPENKLHVELYSSTIDFINNFRPSHFKEETILVKGARVFEFERIVQLMEQKVHQTLLEIDLNALVHNLGVFQQLLRPSTKIMAMVKAFSYGSGSYEIANVLQYHKVDYLAVAYADEGIELRKAGISLPIMVMNPEESGFEGLLQYNLEPELFSAEIMNAFATFLEQEGIQQFPVHIEFETGMNRLGFSKNDLPALIDRLKGNLFKVQSVFTHLVASEDPKHDQFTQKQAALFIELSDEIKKTVPYPFLKHIANTAAIKRHPSLQMDMVRLGIGLYGIDSSGENPSSLKEVSTLRSTVAQVKEVKPGESVSYNRVAMMKRDSIVATIRIGYADGYPRSLGNGSGKMLIKGKLAPILGTVCMDMTMIDITDIPGIAEGDDVILFGKELSVNEVADWAGTIPYEILTGISQRVKRIYFEE